MHKYLVLGSGLAGTTLSLELLSRGCEVILIHNPKTPSSSMVAGGMFNPVTGKHLAKTWMAEDLFPFIHQYYPYWEKKLQSSFFHSIPVYRPFINFQQKEQFIHALDKHELRAYANTIETPEDYQEILLPKLGGIQIQKSGWVDVPKFLQAAKEYLKEKCTFIEAPFDYSELKSNQYKEWKFSRVIFCEGFYLGNNPWFNWVPLNPVKGETLRVRLDVQIKHILNQGAWLIPYQDGTARLGATYSWHDLNFTNTKEAREELLIKAAKFCTKSFSVMGQQAGVRPASKDRRPILGKHPKEENYFLFNGLGTKGVSLAPFWAKEFCDFLEGRKELNQEVTIERYYTLY